MSPIPTPPAARPRAVVPRAVVLRALALASLLPLLAACAGGARHHRMASVVDYLYHDRPGTVATPAIPALELPLRVGIAFVPEASPDGRSTHAAPTALGERDRLALMEEIGRRFAERPFVREIVPIPSAYVQPRGGFANLEQIRAMFGVDVVVLLSYDQVQFTEARRSSLAYWTIVGAYVVEGERNDTRTLLDAAVFDVRSRTLLFRAPGLSTVRDGVTAATRDRERRADAGEGFALAAADLVANLDVELDRFRDRVRERPQEYRVSERPGHEGRSGAGAVDRPLLLGAAAWLALATATRRALRVRAR